MDINSIKRKLLVKYPLFGGIVANAKLIPELSVETAGTDGKDIYYNPQFIESLKTDEQVFIFAHEVCHIAFNHIFRSEGKDKEIWNTATDSVVNALLQKDGLSFVEGGVDIPEAINYDAETMYEMLLEKKQEEEKRQQEEKKQQDGKESGDSSESNDSSGNNSSVEHGKQGDNSENTNVNGNNPTEGEPDLDSMVEEDKKHDVGLDTHSLWGKAVEEKKREDESKDQKEEPVPNQSEQDTFKQNKIERDKQLDELRKSLASKSHGYGTDTDSEYIKVENIGVAKPLIDWRYLLRESINLDVDWSYQNAEIEDGVVVPHLEEQIRPETEILLDTSGSIDETLLKNFLRECKNIIQTSKVKVGCFDTRFYGFNEIRNISDIDNLQFQGGGGTNFNVAVDAFSNRVENKIIFTDGEAPMPKKSLNAIWIVFGYEEINPPGGKVIYIDEEQLEDLYNFEIKKHKTM